MPAHDFEPKPDIRPNLLWTPCKICDNPESAAIHQPPRYMVPELQIHISEEGLEAAVMALRNRSDAYDPDEQVVSAVIAAALASPPTVTEQTVETLVRALLATYPDHHWGDIKLREMVEGLLLSLGVEVAK